MAAKRKPAQAPDPAAEREIPQQEKDAVGALLEEINRAKTLQDRFHKTSLPDLRRYSWGTKHNEEGSTASTRTNLIYATIATLIPHVYAKNPELSVAPTEAVDHQQYDQIKKFCQTAQILENRVLIEEGNLKRRAKSNVRSAMTTSVGWIKMTYQKSLDADPLILRRHNDLQDNLQRIEHLIAKTKAETDLTALNRQRAELQQQLASIMESSEVKVFKGFAIDRIQTEDMLILDESVVDFDDYVNAAKLAHRVWMTDDIFEQNFGHKPYRGTTAFGRPATIDQDDAGQKIEGAEGDTKTQYRAVWEIWDKRAGTVYTVAEGSPGWCREPYRPKPVPERWYPFYCLGFNLVEGRWRPLSDVELLRHLQDEYNTTRYLFAETRKESIPTRVFRKGGNLTEEDINNLKNRRAREWIGIEGNPNIPIEQDIAQLDGAQIDPQAFDVTVIRNDMDMMVGLSDASRSNLIQAKTATEAEIMRQSLMNRVAERQDANEDLISDMAVAALEIMLQELEEAEVKQIAGPEAVWPKLDPEEIFRQVRVSVRAGSTGKPNTIKEREQWAVIMPILKETITQVAELRATGQFDMADSLIELLKETLKRYDERLDIDRFIPRPEIDPATGQPIQQQNAMAQLPALMQENEQLKQALSETQTQLQEAQQGQQAKVAEAESKRAIETARETAKAEEARAKQMQADAEARAKAEAELAKHRETLTSQERMAREKLANERRIALMQVMAKTLTQPAQPAGDGEGGAAGDGAARSAAPDPQTMLAQLEEALGPMDMPSEEGEMMAGVLDNVAAGLETYAQAAGGEKALEMSRDENGTLRARATPVKRASHMGAMSGSGGAMAAALDRLSMTLERLAQSASAPKEIEVSRGDDGVVRGRAVPVIH